MRAGSGRTNARGLRLCACLLVCCALAPGCISLDVERETQTSGTFSATGWGLTILSWDIPKAAIDVARENVSDARLSNVKVTGTRVFPYLGWFDWVQDIAGIRFAKIRGTWGFSGEE